MAITTALRTSVTELYVALFGRAPDADGLGYWVNEADTKGLSFVADAMYDTTPARTYYPLFLTDSEFVEKVYVNVLGRASDTDGSAYWAGRLAVLGKADLVLEMLTATKSYAGTDATALSAQALYNNKVAVADYYAVTLQGNAAGATAAIAGVTATSDVSTPAAIASIISASGATPGSTFTLTTGFDGFTGTSGNDTFNAPNTAATAAAATFNTLDTLVGGAGTDTLNISGQGIGETVTLANVSGVEVVKVYDTTGVTTSLLGSTGVTSVVSNASTAATTFSNIGATTVALGVTNSAVGATFGFTAAAVAGTADSATLTLTAQTAGTNVIAGVETLNIVSSGSANAVTGLTTAAATTWNTSGDQTLNLGTVAATVLTVNSSAATAGVTYTIGNNTTAVTLTGGSGADAITMTGGTAVNDNISAGAGNDTVTVELNLATTDTINGGDGTDTLASTTALLTAYSKPATATITNFETISVTNALAGALTTANVQTGIDRVNLVGGAGGNTITFEAGSKTLGFSTAAAAATIVSDTGTATTDTLAVLNTSAATDVYNAQNLTINGFETVNINSGTTTTRVSNDFGTITLTGDGGAAGTINFAGNNAVTTGIITVASSSSGVVDASGLTLVAGLAQTGQTVGVTSIIGSANADTLVGSATATTISGGAGNDNITGGAAADSITGGAGDDTIAGAGGNDVITGGDGNDQVTDATAGSVNIDMGAGNDTYITTDALLTSGDTVVGGDGTDTFTTSTAISSGTNGARVSGFEILSFGENSGTQNLALFTNNAFPTVLANAATTTFTNAASTVATLRLNAASTTATTFSRLVDTSADVLTITAVAAVSDTAVSVADEETLTIGSSTFGSTIGTLTATDVTSLTLTGSSANVITNAITGAAALATVNASAVSGTGAVTVNGTNSAVAMTVTGGTTTGTQTFTTGSGNDVITGGVTTGALVATGGSGADTITGNAGADSLTGGSGIDSLTGGEGADVITGGTGNDIIVLTENVAAADNVVLATAATNGVDTISSFAVGTGDDTVTFQTADTTVATGAGVAVFTTVAAATLVTAAAYNLAAVASTATTDVWELLGTTAANGDLSVGTDGTELLKLLGTADSAATGITTTGEGNAFFIMAYDNGNAYLYNVLEGAGTVTAVAADIKLVGIFTGIAVGGFTSGDILTVG